MKIKNSTKTYIRVAYTLSSISFKRNRKIKQMMVHGIKFIGKQIKCKLNAGFLLKKMNEKF